MTKDERYTCYCIMLAEIETNFFIACSGNGFCSLLYFELDFGASIFHSWGLKSTLPELYTKRPKPTEYYWFDTNKDGWQKRIEYLKQCIKETHP